MLLRLLTLATLATTTAACFGESDPVLRITDLEITGETDFGALDVEVHLFDQTSREHLGCAGNEEGLEEIDASDVHYAVDAFFRRSGSDNEVYPDELEGRVLELIVIEDDLAPCPAPPGPDDDVVGLLADSDLVELEAGPTLGFDDVVLIRVAVE